MDLKYLWHLIRYSIFNPWTKYGFNQRCEMCGKRRFILKSCLLYWTCSQKISGKCVRAAIEQSDIDKENHLSKSIRDNL